MAANIIIRNSTVSNNIFSTTVGATRAGGLYLSGPSLLDNVIASGNRGPFSIIGAHIYSPPNKKLTITASTFDTTSGSNEEIIYAPGSELKVSNSTFKSTSSTLIQLSSTATAYIESTTLDTDYYAVDFRLNEGTLTIKSSVVRAGNLNCTTHVNPVVSQGYNIFSDNSCATADPRDLINTNPLLNGLANNGAATMTISTMASSPARNLVPIAECLLTDQRGVARTGNFCDAGSFED